MRVVGSTPGQNNRLTFIVYVSAIVFAEHSIHLTNAYFIPDDQILDAFTDRLIELKKPAGAGI